MLDYFSQVYVLLASKLFLDVYVQGCDERWFGASCNYMCHCEKYKSCDVNGQCPNSDRLDLVGSDAVVSVQAYLKDGDETTCNPDVNASSVEISLNKAHPFSWFRIHAISSDNLLSFTTKLNNGTACINERKFLVSDTVVDVTCDKISLNKLQITGALVPNVCSVYINGGRNLALNQTAMQTSNLDYINRNSCRAGNAVDGFTDSDYRNGHCSSTAIEKELPVWLLLYSMPLILYKVRIYNRNAFQDRLKNFVLTTFGISSTAVTTKSLSSAVSWTVKEIDMDSQTPIKSLRIQQGRTQSPEDQILTLCEVETFGDIVCPNNTYGLNCEGRCNCSKSETCSPVTGACSPRCPPGFYGQNCVARCSRNCLHEICKYSSGDCLKCTPGFFGTTCMNACHPGTFGSDCMLNCSEHCLTPCNHISGTCICDKGYRGLICRECRVGFFGENCTTACSSVCKECDMRSGNCTLCFGRHAGRHCEACIPRYYGKNCDQACSVRCVNRTCDYSTGACFECEYGYHGYMCDQEYGPTWMLALLLMYLSFLFYLFYKKRRTSATRTEPEPTLQGDMLVTRPEEKSPEMPKRTRSCSTAVDVNYFK